MYIWCPKRFTSIAGTGEQTVTRIHDSMVEELNKGTKKYWKTHSKSCNLVCYICLTFLRWKSTGSWTSLGYSFVPF